MSIKDRITHAAAEIFAEAGYRGATTRRIAERAGVNEVTIFRHFGSKRELIQEAIRAARPPDTAGVLPPVPADPLAELTEWSERQLEHLRRSRSMIRTCMGESEEHPEIMESAAERPTRVREQLMGYLRALKLEGWADPSVNVDVAASLLMGSLFMDAMGRDVMPGMFQYEESEAPRLYVELLLRAMGVKAPERSVARSGGTVR